MLVSEKGAHPSMPERSSACWREEGERRRPQTNLKHSLMLRMTSRFKYGKIRARAFISNNVVRQHCIFKYDKHDETDMVLIETSKRTLLLFVI